ncbi:MAG: N-acetylglucosamine-6-phosphate deacetylase [Acetobacteraceae bacterium]|nr:N-acetylglucosamine-6-phosphate deacetylase [Acetobacteraceae bacterium]
MRTPGLLDVQVNGYAGVDFNDSALTADALDHALDAMLRAGVTHCLPTLITAPADELAARLQALDRAIRTSRLGPLMVPGIHLEGPFLNPAPGYAGCHPAAAMVPPDPALLIRLTAGMATPIRLLTLAPEQPGALPLIVWAGRHGIVTAMGHTAAGHDIVRQAAAAGLSLSTHLGNALPQPQPKFLSPLIAQLAEDRLTASFIADGIHVPPHALKVMLRAKGPGRCILVTDGTAASDAPPGLYDFAGMRIEHAADGSVREPGSSVLAGSALCLDQAVRNIVNWGFASVVEAMAMASSRPAALLGMAGVPSSVTWDDGIHPREVTVGDITVTLPARPAR